MWKGGGIGAASGDMASKWIRVCGKSMSTGWLESVGRAIVAVECASLSSVVLDVRGGVHRVDKRHVKIWEDDYLEVIR